MLASGCRIWAVALIFWSPLAVASGEPQDLQLAEQILSEYWHREGDNNEHAAAAYEQATAPSVESRMAYTLQRMNHFRYREALSVAREVAQLAPNSPEALAVLCWLETLLELNNEALVDLQRLRRAIDGLDPADPQRQFYLRHLGRLLGFIEGPGNRQVNRETFLQTETALQQGLTPEENKLLADARQEILDQFNQLQANQDQARNDFLAEAQKKAAAEIAAIQANNQNLKQARDQIPARIQASTNAFQQRSTALRNQIQPLESQFRIVQNQILPLQTQWQSLVIQIDLWDRRFSHPDRPPTYWDQVFRNQLAMEALRIDATIAGLQNQMWSLEAQVAQLNRELFQLNQQHQAELQSLNSESQNLTRQMERNSVRIQKLMAGPARVTGEAMAIGNRINKLKTYYDFPLESFRGELLKKLQAKR